MADKTYRLKVPEITFDSLTLDQIKGKSKELETAGIKYWTVEPKEEDVPNVDVDSFAAQEKGLRKEYQDSVKKAKAEYEAGRKLLLEEYHLAIQASWGVYTSRRQGLLNELLPPAEGEKEKNE